MSMDATDPNLFLGLDPQPKRFDATVRIDVLYNKANRLLQESSSRDGAIRRFVLPAPEALDLTEIVQATELAALAALQSYVDNGELILNVFSPTTDRFFKLPPSALRPPVAINGVGGHELFDGAAYAPEATWRTGRLCATECSTFTSALGRARLPVFVAASAEKSCLEKLRHSLRTAAPLNLTQTSDDEVIHSIRLLVQQRGGHLPLNEGAALLRQLHPDVTRDAARSLIRVVLGPQKPGPRGPRKRAAAVAE